jgi:hypothetical protein
MATEGVDLCSLVDLMIAGEADEREAGAFAVAEFVAESDSHQVLYFDFDSANSLETVC